MKQTRVPPNDTSKGASTTKPLNKTASNKQTATSTQRSKTAAS